MSTRDAMEIAQAVLLAVGGGGLIVLALRKDMGIDSSPIEYRGDL